MRLLGLALVAGVAALAWYIGREMERDRVANLYKKAETVVHSAGGEVWGEAAQ